MTTDNDSSFDNTTNADAPPDERREQREAPFLTGVSRRQVTKAAGIALAGAVGGAAVASQTVEAAPSGEIGTSANPLLQTHVDRLVFNERTSDPSSPADGELWYNSSA